MARFEEEAGVILTRKVHPVLFQFDLHGRAVRVSAYGAAFFAAAIVMLAVSMSVARWMKVPRGRVMACAAAALIGLVVGARLLFWVTNLPLYREHPGRFFSTTLADFSLSGGLILAGALVTVVCAIARWNAWTMADALTPGTMLALAIVRVGCLMNGCCFGERCDWPWAITFPSGSLSHIYQMARSPALIVAGPQPVHPTQIYEMVAATIASVAAVVLSARRTRAGIACLAAVAMFMAFRLLNHQFRPIEPGFGGPPMLYPLIYSAVVAACLLAIVVRNRSRQVVLSPV